MNAYEVKLAHHGFFEIPAVLPDGISFRVGFNPDVKSNPWSVLAQDEEGIKWCCVRAFNDLDRALAFAVSQANEMSPESEFVVSLPCGSRFRRPGKISAESVMASMGWVYVHEFLAYAGIRNEALTTAELAREAFEEKVEGTMVMVDDVDFVGDEDGYWCATYVLPYDGFIHQERIVSEVAICFASEGVETFSETYDFRCRKLSVPNAKIISLNDYRAAKAKAA